MRLPRPSGFTEAVQTAKNSKDENVLFNIKQRAVQLWLLSNGTLFNNQLSLSQLSVFLKLDPEIIRNHMRDQFLSTGIWDETKREQLISSLTGQIFSWSLDDKLQIDKQTEILQRAQGSSYKPFITSELNKILSTKISSTKAFTDLLKTITSQPVISIQQNNNSLTINEALELLQDQPLSPLEHLSSSHDLSSLPDIHPDQQRESDSSLDNSSLRQITDNYKETTIEFNREHHSKRRELELHISQEDSTIPQ